jgi:hypothetical protein
MIRGLFKGVAMLTAGALFTLLLATGMRDYAVTRASASVDDAPAVAQEQAAPGHAEPGTSGHWMF